jgi:hypothetical protein
MYTSLGQVMMRGNLSLFSRVPLTMASMMLGWSDPRFTKQCVTPASHSASKKADDAVYVPDCTSVEELSTAEEEKDDFWISPVFCRKGVDRGWLGRLDRDVMALLLAELSLLTE